MHHTIRRYINKVFTSSAQAIADMKSGNSLIVGGFGLCGIPENLLRALSSTGLRELTVYSTLAGTTDQGLGLLTGKKMIHALHTSYIGENAEAERQYLNGEIELHITPMGSLIERIRAGSNGILGFYCRTGTGTVIEEGGFPIKYFRGGKGVERYSIAKHTKMHNDKVYVYENSITADFAFVKAWKADPMGNLVFRKTARNSNADVPGAARVTIAEVEEIVPTGSLDPDQIHVPGILVQRVIKGEQYIKPIEKLTVHKPEGITIPGTPKQQKIHEIVAKRAAKEVKHGMVVNLGIGIPTLISNYVSKDINIILHAENGLLGMGPYPEEGKQDPDLVGAGKETVTVKPGASVFSQATSFGLMRGGHLNLACLGALQVSQDGDLASWIVPGKMVKGMGGAMDLVNNKTKCIVCMEHTADGVHKIVKTCSLPVTGKKCVNMVITEQGVFEFRDRTGLTLTEIAPGITLDEIKNNTSAKFHVDSGLKTMIV